MDTMTLQDIHDRLTALGIAAGVLTEGVHASDGEACAIEARNQRLGRRAECRDKSEDGDTLGRWARALNDTAWSSNEARTLALGWTVFCETPPPEWLARVVAGSFRCLLTPALEDLAALGKRWEIDPRHVEALKQAAIRCLAVTSADGAALDALDALDARGADPDKVLRIAAEIGERALTSDTPWEGLSETCR